MTSLTHKAREVFAHDRYATEVTGAVIEEADERGAVCSLCLTPQHRNAMGGVMGGVLFTLADLAFAVAANSGCVAEERPIAWMSTNSTIHYLAQPHGDRLTAHARCVKQGRSQCLYTIDIVDNEGRMVAVVTTEGRNSA